MHDFSPDTRGSIEIKTAISRLSCAVLNHEVAIKHDRGDLSEEILLTIAVSPSRLNHSDIWIVKMRA